MGLQRGVACTACCAQGLTWCHRHCVWHMVVLGMGCMWYPSGPALHTGPAADSSPQAIPVYENQWAGLVWHRHYVQHTPHASPLCQGAGPAPHMHSRLELLCAAHRAQGWSRACAIWDTHAGLALFAGLGVWDRFVSQSSPQTSPASHI